MTPNPRPYLSRNLLGLSISTTRSWPCQPKNRRSGPFRLAACHHPAQSICIFLSVQGRQIETPSPVSAHAPPRETFAHRHSVNEDPYDRPSIDAYIRSCLQPSSVGWLRLVGQAFCSNSASYVFLCGHFCDTTCAFENGSHDAPLCPCCAPGAQRRRFCLALLVEYVGNSRELYAAVRSRCVHLQRLEPHLASGSNRSQTTYLKP